MNPLPLPRWEYIRWLRTELDHPEASQFYPEVDLQRMRQQLEELLKEEAEEASRPAD